MDIVPVTTIRGEARVSSRDLAQALGNKHKNVMSLLNDYQSEFEALGVLAFETEKPLEGSLGGRPTQFAYLNENQCYFLLTLVRNSDLVVQLKLGLVKAFAHARENAQAAPLTLPTDPVELLALSLQGLQQHRKQLAAIEERLDSAPIRTNSAMRARVHSACQQFGRVHPRSFAGAYRAFKEAFGFQGTPLAAYDDLPQSRLQEALTWLDVQIKTFSAQRPLLDEVGD